MDLTTMDIKFYKNHNTPFVGGESFVYIMRSQNNLYAVKFKEIERYNEEREFESIQKMVKLNEYNNRNTIFTKIIHYGIFREKAIFNNIFPEIHGFLEDSEESVVVYTTEVLFPLDNLIYIPRQSVLELLIGYLIIASKEEFIIGDIDRSNIMWKKSFFPRYYYQDNFVITSEITMSFIDYGEIQSVNSRDEILTEFHNILTVFIDLIEEKTNDESFVLFLNFLFFENDINKIIRIMISQLSQS